MNEAFVDINGVRTKVVTFGRWIEDSPGNTNEIILLFPGTSGVASFYDEFIKTLYEKTKIPVWCVTHAGHNFGEKDLVPFPNFEQNKDLYGLKGQVQHKIDFFRKYVPDNAKVYLVGHSIGGYMCVEILEDEHVKNKVEKTILLFPTLEHMVKTWNGLIVNTFVRPIVSIILFLCGIFNRLPSIISSFLLYVYMFIRNVPRETQTKSITELLKPGLLRRVFYLIFEEMDQVKDRNNGVIERNVDSIRFFYGKTDGWTPAGYIDNLKRDVPAASARMELTDIQHTFVFHHSVDVAHKVAGWIKEEK